MRAAALLIHARATAACQTDHVTALLANVMETDMSDTLDRMRRNPAADWTIADVASVCAQHGVRCVPPSGGGSHYKVSHPSQQSILTVPRSKPVKPVYIRKLVKFIEVVGGAGAPP